MTTPLASPDFPLSSGSGGQPPRHSRRRRILKWSAITLVVVVLLGAGGIYGDYLYLNGKITKIPIYVPSTGPSRPPILATKAENFVLIGSDSRAGASGKGTGGNKFAGSARSDTTIIMHIAANNTGATLISIPRDSYVQIPSCVIGPNGQTSEPETSKFNAAFSLGGQDNPKYAASCTVHTIETLTGIRINHYAVIDFAGFQKMVSALGGVKMCVAEPLNDPIVNEGNGNFHGSGLKLPAGKSVEIDGQQALDLMRARYNLDGGGDLPRIKRQQEFIAAMIRKATSTGLLVHPFRLQHFLSAATSSLTTDGFGIGTMKKLASALHHVGAGGVRILTVPLDSTLPPGVPTADVAWDPVKSAALWDAIRHDRPIPGSATAKPTPSPTPTVTTSPTGPTLTEPPSDINVIVQNGTSQNGLAHKVAAALALQGFHIVSVGDASQETYTSTVVEYGSSKVQSSQTVAASLPGSVRQADSSAGSTITVIVGSDFTKVVPVTVASSTSTPTPTPTPSQSIASVSAAKPGCLS